MISYVLISLAFVNNLNNSQFLLKSVVLKFSGVYCTEGNIIQILVVIENGWKHAQYIWILLLFELSQKVDIVTIKFVPRSTKLSPTRVTLLWNLVRLLLLTGRQVASMRILGECG